VRRVDRLFENDLRVLALEGYLLLGSDDDVSGSCMTIDGAFTVYRGGCGLWEIFVRTAQGDQRTYFMCSEHVAKKLVQEFSRTGLLPTPDKLYFSRTSTFGRWMVRNRYA
jgi:hypothetical protein